MNKSNLKPGMEVTFKRGLRAIIVSINKTHIHFRSINPNERDAYNWAMNQEFLKDDLTYPLNNELDIIHYLEYGKPMASPKSLLTAGRVVKLRDDSMCIVMQEFITGTRLFLNLKSYHDDCTCRVNNGSRFDIMAIYDAPFCNEDTWRLSKMNSRKGLVEVWKREEKSKAQIEKESIQAEMSKLVERLKELEVK